MPMMIADLPLRTKIKFGAYSVNGEIPHKIRWLKAHGDNTFISEFLEDQCAFDGKEPNNGMDYRRSYGNNRYLVSNTNQFLNTSGVNWFTPQHPDDTPPEARNMYGEKNGYADKPGFLTLFDEWELEAIEPTEIITAKPTCDIENGEPKYDKHFVKIFTPSRTNLTGREENGVKEGEYWDIFQNGESIACPLSPECYEYGTCDEKPEDPDANWYYCLRSPYADNECYVRYVFRGGDVGNIYAYGGIMGLRPALKLNPEILISDEPDEEGYYEVLGIQQEIIEIGEQDFFAILLGN